MAGGLRGSSPHNAASRAELQASKRYGLSRTTVTKWRARTSTADASCRTIDALWRAIGSICEPLLARRMPKLLRRRRLRSHVSVRGSTQLEAVLAGPRCAGVDLDRHV
jgi:hypothetical protein